MPKILTAILLALTALPLQLKADEITYQKEDSAEIAVLLSAKGTHSPLYFAKKLLGRPYVGQTLEINEEEQLVVNLRELDCTTLVETSAALALAEKNNERSFTGYCKALKQLRYRNGNISGYASRLHYFSQWIADNVAKGLVEDIGTSGGFPFTAKQELNLSFMTKNPQYYRQLKADEDLRKEIEKQEKSINGTIVNYIPKNLLNLDKTKLNCIHDGDIIALVTSKDGLDISHVGIAIWKGNKLHLLNASSLKHKVVADSQSLYEYQRKRQTQLGIRVIRLR